MSPAGQRGRPRQFDCDDVVDRLVGLFWQKGYEATSLSDIVDATGLNKSSLYNTFGGKEELLELALQRYLDMRVAALSELLTDGDAGLADIERFLDYVEMEARGDQGRGCLAVNMTTELAPTDPSVAQSSLAYRTEIRTALRAALDRAEAAGEIEPGRARGYTEILLSFLLSLTVIARSGASSDEIGDQLAAVRALVADWRRTPAPVGHPHHRSEVSAAPAKRGVRWVSATRRSET